MIIDAGRTGKQRVPPPEETPVEVVVSGHTSTLKRIRIVRTGSAVPVTFSRDLMTHTEGFAWYVSRHFALKTDYPEARAHELLTLLELAFPHYVALFGREIPDLDRKRMACVYGASMETLEKAMRDDHMHVFGGGGITQEGFWACYQRPSNEYHCRYILIHECVHLYQYCLERTTTNMCTSFIEGVADRLSTHVYDPVRKRLTVNVLDRAPVHNFLEYGKRHLAKHRKLGFHDFVKGGERGLNVVATTFLQRNPEAVQKWRIYRDEMFRTATPATRQDTAERLIRGLYGSPARVWSDFKGWMRTLRPTFYMADWGFDQYGDTLVSFGTPRDKRLKRFSQMDINLVPGRKPTSSLFQMDYPRLPDPDIVGPVKRGVEEPVVGFVADFSRAKGLGQAGLGLGREGLKHFRVLIDGASRLVVDGTDFRGSKRVWALPPALRQAMHEDGERVGVTVTIGMQRLQVMVRAGGTPRREFRASMGLGRALRRRLVSLPMAVLGVGARHLITPCVDDGRPLAPNLDAPAPPNPWRNAADRELFLAYRACWRLGRKAPPALRQASRELLKVAAADENTQKAAAATFHGRLPSLVRAIRLCGAERERVQRTINELSGVSMDVVLADGPRRTVEAEVRMTGPVCGRAEGRVSIRSPAPLTTDAIALTGGAAPVLRQRIRGLEGGAPFAVRAEARLRWLGVSVVLRSTAVGHAAIPRCWCIGPFDNQGQLQDTEHPIEKGTVDVKRVHRGQTGTLVAWRRVERPPELPVEAEHLVYFNRLFGQQANHAFAYMLASVRSPRDGEALLAVGASDGLAVWINGEKVFTNLRARDWSPREDKVPIRLKKGLNTLLLKSIHATGLWFLSAHIEDVSGQPFPGLRYL